MDIDRVTHAFANGYRCALLADLHLAPSSMSVRDLEKFRGAITTTLVIAARRLPRSDKDRLWQLADRLGRAFVKTRDANAIWHVAFRRTDPAYPPFGRHRCHPLAGCTPCLAARASAGALAVVVARFRVAAWCALSASLAHRLAVPAPNVLAFWVDCNRRTRSGNTIHDERAGQAFSNPKGDVDTASLRRSATSEHAASRSGRALRPHQSQPCLSAMSAPRAGRSPRNARQCRRSSEPGR